jgi:hypothetical protein
VSFRLPTEEQRVTVVGRTGSGKTWFGAWLLSKAPFHRQPYIIIDYKGDKLLRSIEGVRELSLYEKLPDKPGLFTVRPLLHEEEAMETWLWNVWQRERIGLYFDEAFMLPNSGYSRRGALQAILTQGRSKKIPVISLVQRPSQISLFVFSEADYYAVFHLNRRQDRKTMTDLGDGLDATTMPPYHSTWYDVGADKPYNLLPVPDGEVIAADIEKRLRVKRVFI